MILKAEEVRLEFSENRSRRTTFSNDYRMGRKVGLTLLFRRSSSPTCTCRPTGRRQSRHSTPSPPVPARAAAAVYILGDLFDWWVGDDQMREPFIVPIVASAARQFPMPVCRCSWPAAIAISCWDTRIRKRDRRHAVTRPALVLDLHGVPTVVGHGDELCTDDARSIRFIAGACVRTPDAMRRLSAPAIRRCASSWRRGCAARAAATNRSRPNTSWM